VDQNEKRRRKKQNDYNVKENKISEYKKYSVSYKRAKNTCEKEKSNKN
jgi:hypothetical protein